MINFDNRNDENLDGTQAQILHDSYWTYYCTNYIIVLMEYSQS